MTLPRTEPASGDHRKPATVAARAAAPQVIGGRPLDPTWRVTHVTAPWRIAYDLRRPNRPMVRHAVTFLGINPSTPIALCRGGIWLAPTEAGAEDAEDCIGCRIRMEAHGLYPLD